MRDPLFIVRFVEMIPSRTPPMYTVSSTCEHCGTEILVQSRDDSNTFLLRMVAHHRTVHQ